MHLCFLSQLKDSTLKTHGRFSYFPLSLSFLSFLVYSPYPRSLFLNSKATCSNKYFLEKWFDLLSSTNMHNSWCRSLIDDKLSGSRAVYANWLWLCPKIIVKKPNLLSACDLQYTTSPRSLIESKPSWTTLRTIILTIIRTNENKNRPLLRQDQSYNNGKSV